MLKSLSVRNYALISTLDVDFNNGLSAITGETGAGKSILMGALGLVLGDRADSGALNNKAKKCVVEASFEVKGLDLEAFFSDEDLDYDDKSIIRRELLPSGKSRAFINDTPVTLPVLKRLGERLVNIHAQHHNLMLKEESFPLDVVDGYLGLEEKIRIYSESYYQYKNLKERIGELERKLTAARKEQDYLEFQYNQLLEADLQPGEEEQLVNEQEKLSHIEEIGIALNGAIDSLSDNETNMLQQLKNSQKELGEVSKYLSDLEEPSERLESVYIELKDLSEELERLSANIESDPERLNFLNERLDMIYSLQRKHQVGSVNELIDIREELSGKLKDISISDTELVKLNNELTKAENKLVKHSEGLRKERLAGVRKLSGDVVDGLREIGMPHASFEVRHSALDDFTEKGRDKFSFYFSANKNRDVELVQKVASGGEISRLMLSIKSLISKSLAMPTLIFDEIDAGVSGEIADKMGKMLRDISKDRQVLNVTHLPQVAGRGDFHYQVFKYEEKEQMHTGIRMLDNDGRIMEMAKMLSGEQLTQEALGNAKALLHKS